jgi:carboxyl-terminal processing protease
MVDGLPLLDEDGYPLNLLSGPEGTTITLTVQTPGSEPKEVQVTRRRITGDTPIPHQVLESPTGKRIGYLMLTTFNESTVDENFEKALIELSAQGTLDGLIVDNRQNEGGVDTEMTGTLSFFTDGIVGHFINRQYEDELRVEAKDIGGSQRLPLVVLVGEETASFGEIFSGILHDLGRASLIGETTLGNIEILWEFRFRDGSRAFIAHDIFRPLNDPQANWEETGIIPDRTVESNWDEITMETDPVIRAALEHFDQ